MVGSSTLQDNFLAGRGWSLGHPVRVSNHDEVTTAQPRQRIYLIPEEAAYIKRAQV